MKFLLTPFLLLFMVLPIKAQSIENHTFELSDTAFSSGLKGWKSNKLFTVAPDEIIRHGGHLSIRLKSIPGQQFGAFSQLVALPKATGLRKYRISGWLRRDSVEGFAGIWINVFEGKNSLFFDNMYKRQLNGTADWQEVSTECFVDEVATDIQIGGLLAGSGQVWFDDFSLTEMPLDAGNLPDSLKQYLHDAVDIMQKNALHRDLVNWPKEREVILLMASGAKSYADCYPVIRHLLGKLGDHHSFLMEAEQSARWSNPNPEAYQQMPLTTGSLLEGNIAYLNMPSVSSGDEKTNTFFADKLHDLIDSLDQFRPKGWILDLRNNSGGNCWPMLAGIGPVLGEGKCGYFMELGGKTSGAWFYKKGKSGIGKKRITKVSRKPYQLFQKNAPVAVLTGKNTASSGEVVTVAFRGRPNTRSFGAPTAGLSTGNQNFRLKDGAQLFLTTTVYADRTRETYGAKIKPDVELPEGTAGAADPVIQAAKDWLNSLK
ncbi:MAG: hypothetical protein IT261_02535 [Saprospiraceae bacterium]|nr:hypothetical protein [Saprospiraceae bacterium]